MAESPESPETAASLEDRLWRAHTSMDPDVLWPGVTRDLLDASLREIVRVTRLALSGGPEQSGVPTLSPAQVRAFGIAAFASGTGPLLGYWIERERVRAGPEVAAVLRRHRAHAIHRHQMLADRLGVLLQAMADRGVTPTILKGMHTAWRYLPDPGTRTIGDIDVLVRASQLEQATGALRASGLLEICRTAHPFRSVWAPSANMPVHSLDLDHADNPWSVDLHIALERRYARGVRASLDPAGPAPTEEFTIAGRPARGLAQPWLATFLALHASYGLYAFQLGRLVELILVIRQDRTAGSLQETEWLALLRTTGTAGFVYPALELAEHLAPGTVAPPLLALARAAASARSRRVVQAMIRHGGYRLPHRSMDDRLMWASGPRETLLMLSELLWPSDSSLGDALRTLARRAEGIRRGWLRWRVSGPGPRAGLPPAEPPQQPHAADEP